MDGSGTIRRQWFLVGSSVTIAHSTANDEGGTENIWWGAHSGFVVDLSGPLQLQCWFVPFRKSRSILGLSLLGRMDLSRSSVRATVTPCLFCGSHEEEWDLGGAALFLSLSFGRLSD